MGAVITRPHIARALIEIGAATSIEDAFVRYLNRGQPAFVDRERLLPPDAVRLVRAAGGVPVLAHPLSVADLDATLTEMVAAGLLGLEAYYGAYTPEQRATLAALAARHGFSPPRAVIFTAMFMAVRCPAVRHRLPASWMRLCLPRLRSADQTGNENEGDRRRSHCIAARS